MILIVQKKITQVARLGVNRTADIRNLPLPSLGTHKHICWIKSKKEKKNQILKFKIKKGKSLGTRDGKKSKGMNWWGMKKTKVRKEENGFSQGILGKKYCLNSYRLGV